MDYCVIPWASWRVPARQRHRAEVKAAEDGALQLKPSKQKERALQQKPRRTCSRSPGSRIGASCSRSQAAEEVRLAAEAKAALAASPRRFIAGSAV